MAIASGTRLGPYEILAPLGAGGMGEVYRARDSRLDRTVAIKVLPSHVAGDLHLKQRFEREARTLASLSHPHICPVFDVGQQDGVDFLVMEYLEGETLADRLARAGGPEGPPLRLDDALRIAIEIADALDKAHRKGIVHRDLKPGNVMLTRSGGPSGPSISKLLDFGLAKLQPAGAVAGPSMAATMTSPLTGHGTILGTLQYMAPEQLEGKDADARTDVFAFGALLYEMLTGRKAFQGQSQASLIAAIMHADPPPMSEIQPLTPRPLNRIVQKCLAKDPDARWQDARDLVDELKWTADSEAQPRESTTVPVAVAGLRVLKPSWIVVLVASVAAAAATGVSMWVMSAGRSNASPEPAIRFAVDLPPGISFGSRAGRPLVALSPDGGLLAYTPGGRPNTWLSLRRLEPA